MASRKKRAKSGTGGAAAEQRKRLFVDAYFANNQNLTATMKALGYSPKTAGTQGSRMFKDVQIQSAIAARREELGKQFALSSQTVFDFWGRMARLDVGTLFGPDGELLPVHEMPEDARLLIDGLDVKETEGRGIHSERTYTSKIDFPKRAAVMEQVARHFGMFARDKQGARQEDDEPPPAVAVTIDFKDARRRKP